MKSPERPITTTQAARLVKISSSTILRAVISKKIPSFKTPGGHYRLSRADVLKFFQVGRSKIGEMAETIAEMECLFELQRARVAEASRQWQRLTGQRNIHPGLGQLIAWLMDQAELDYDKKKLGLGKSDPKLHRAWRKRWMKWSRDA